MQNNENKQESSISSLVKRLVEKNETTILQSIRNSKDNILEYRKSMRVRTYDENWYNVLRLTRISSPIFSFVTFIGSLIGIFALSYVQGFEGFVKYLLIAFAGIISILFASFPEMIKRDVGTKFFRFYFRDKDFKGILLATYIITCLFCMSTGAYGVYWLSCEASGDFKEQATFIAYSSLFFMFLTECFLLFCIGYAPYHSYVSLDEIDLINNPKDAYSAFNPMELLRISFEQSMTQHPNIALQANQLLGNQSMIQAPNNYYNDLGNKQQIYFQIDNDIMIKKQALKAAKKAKKKAKKQALKNAKLQDKVNSDKDIIHNINYSSDDIKALLKAARLKRNSYRYKLNNNQGSASNNEAKVKEAENTILRLEAMLNQANNN